jgi:hypothetical protein
MVAMVAMEMVKTEGMMKPVPTLSTHRLVEKAMVMAKLGTLAKIRTTELILLEVFPATIYR